MLQRYYLIIAKCMFLFNLNNIQSKQFHKLLEGELIHLFKIQLSIMLVFFHFWLKKHHIIITLFWYFGIHDIKNTIMKICIQ